MKKKLSSLIEALAVILLGVLFIILKEQVGSIAMTIFGVMLIAVGVVNYLNLLHITGIVEIVLGIIVIVCGWTIAKIVLYVLAVILIVYGIVEILNMLKLKRRGFKFGDTIMMYSAPVLQVLIGILLLMNGFGWVFIVVGVMFIIEGALMLVSGLVNKK